MTQLDDKINQHFAGQVVRKDLVKAVKGNAIVPTYVLEYLLGQYCATNDAATIRLPGKSRRIEQGRFARTREPNHGSNRRIAGHMPDRVDLFDIELERLCRIAALHGANGVVDFIGRYLEAGSA